MPRETPVPVQQAAFHEPVFADTQNDSVPSYFTVPHPGDQQDYERIQNLLKKDVVGFPKTRAADVTAVDQPRINLTAPLLSVDSALWFSAYGFGWGYCAFALPAETVCEKLGAANETPKQLMLAFELGKHRLLQTIARKALPGTGERITLSTADI